MNIYYTLTLLRMRYKLLTNIGIKEPCDFIP